MTIRNAMEALLAMGLLVLQRKIREERETISENGWWDMTSRVSFLYIVQGPFSNLPHLGLLSRDSAAKTSLSLWYLFPNV